MEIDKIVKTVSLIRKKYKDRQQEQSISYLTLRRSSMSELRSSISEEIPKNSLELLQRYRTSRIKIPSYKLDAVELLCSILQRPIKRLFIALQILHKTGPSIKNILKAVSFFHTFLFLCCGRFPLLLFRLSSHNMVQISL